MSEVLSVLGVAGLFLLRVGIPVLILVTSLVVAFIIISLMLPILNLYEIQF